MKVHFLLMISHATVVGLAVFANTTDILYKSRAAMMPELNNITVTDMWESFPSKKKTFSF